MTDNELKLKKEIESLDKDKIIDIEVKSINEIIINSLYQILYSKKEDRFLFSDYLAEGVSEPIFYYFNNYDDPEIEKDFDYIIYITNFLKENRIKIMTIMRNYK
ncbi:hypothetical protein GQX59_08680 [Brachyspira hyodysenteriae]|uniref:hypothetical protein n=1 Tax=Brachyspira hyodysenteriae TaxID=159 RepID=UPI00063DA2F4|nr:hypothetical protein [Brachyspira hyodysenteriae]KLI16440.1 hypothetical protein SU45_07570 [Brachyspira hyodysenteriae]KLI59537.1 hypothetical protein SZ44_08200 [Brachyspira hyodysenteriae]KLI62239.1 hypothetical protein SZ46_02700 [Brachyspira hyodysenteriae]QTM11498.1 hypothetical protein GQX59_08680 [Brachyspira hyodysenteriae]